MISTEKSSSSTALTVSDTPSSATEPFGAMKRASSPRRAQHEARHVGHVLARDHAGDAVDMAGDQMAAELVAEFERPLEIDARAVAPAPDRGDAQRLRGGIDRKPGAAVLLAGADHRQADAGAGDRGALLQFGARIGAGDGQPMQIVRRAA